MSLVRFLVVTLLLGLLAVVGAVAADAPPCVPHRVRSGESFTQLCTLSGCSPQALREMNPDLDTSGLTAGQVVLLPRSPRWIRYRVAHGDTLSELAQRFDTTVTEIQVASGIEDDRLLIGERLVIPRITPPTTAGLGFGASATRIASPTEAPSPHPPQLVPTASASQPPPQQVDSGPEDAILPTWVRVRLSDGRSGWAPSRSLIIGSVTPATPQRLIEIARQFIGTPYRWGGETPNGADCSGFVEEVFHLAGYTLPRTADAQFAATRPVPPQKMQPADLVFFTTYLPGPSHVGIYVGNGEFVHASSHGVMCSNLSESYYAQRFLGARRLAAWDAPPVDPAAGTPVPPPGDPARAIVPSPTDTGESPAGAASPTRSP